MKKIVYLSLVLFIGLTACKDEKSSSSSENPEGGKKKSDAEILAETAMRRNDFTSALVHINQLLLEDSTKTVWMDTLYAIYEQAQNPYAMVDVGEKIIQIRPNDTTLWAPLSQAYALIGDFPKALDMQNRLFDRSKDLRWKLMTANTHYSMGNPMEARNAIQFVINQKAEADKIKIEEPITGSDKFQNIKLTAVAYKMMAAIALEEGNNKEAQAMLDKAIEIEPNYDQAYAMVKQIMYSGSKR